MGDAGHSGHCFHEVGRELRRIRAKSEGSLTWIQRHRAPGRGGLVGIVMLVTTPALLQLMPQYRIRSAASEGAAAIRMIRQRAIATRTPFRITFDPGKNRYRYSMLNTPGADLNVAANWISIDKDGKKRTRVGAPEPWIYVTAVQLAATSNSFKDVVCPTEVEGYADVIFLRDGSVSDNAACGAADTDVLTFSPAPSIVFSVDSNLVRFNHYYVALEENGTVNVRATKE